MKTMKLKTDNLSKNFSDSTIFKDISFETYSGQCLAITGRNGSGKTTLIRVLSRLIQPSKGKISLSENSTMIQDENFYKYIGLVGPYLELYQDLTALENLTFFAKMKEIINYNDCILNLMEMIGLAGRENDLVKTYSSGMKQRLKYAVALLKSPAFLFLDEPGANLDEEGKQLVAGIVDEYRAHSIIIIATNDREESSLAEKQLRLGQ